MASTTNPHPTHQITRDQITDPIGTPAWVTDAIGRVAQDADAAFWAVVARAFPQVTTGDSDPMTVYHRDERNRADVLTWLRDNLRHLTPCVLTVDPSGDFTCACGNAPMLDGFASVSGRDCGENVGYIHYETVEPTDALWPVPLYRCERCRAIYLVPSGLKGAAVAGARDEDDQ